MLKLMKYEFKKQALSKWIMLVLVGLLELLFLFGVVTENEDRIGLAIGLLAIFSIGCLFYVAFESVLTFSNDLKTKCSYMLFLTPNSIYKIVGAKVITAAVQILIVGAAFLLLAIIDINMIMSMFQEVETAWQLIKELLEAFFGVSISEKIIILYIATLILSWICTVCLAFFSITLSTTFLANKRWKGIVSFVIFLGLNWLFSKIVSVSLGNTLHYTTIHYVLNCLYYLLFTIITFVGTGYMLEEKVSV